jgi:amidohydrolase
VAGQIMQAFQTIISRNRKPLEEAVISVTTIHAGDSFNIIPETCELSGTVRAYSRATLDLIERRMAEIASHTAAAHGMQCDFQFNRLYPATVNHAAESALARQVLIELLGPQRVIEQTPIMAAEDFSFMLEAVPGSYCFIGQGDGSHRAPGHGDGPCNVHNPSYDFNDALLPVGASFLARLAERWLGCARP